MRPRSGNVAARRVPKSGAPGAVVPKPATTRGEPTSIGVSDRVRCGAGVTVDAAGSSANAMSNESRSLWFHIGCKRVRVGSMRIHEVDEDGGAVLAFWA